MAEQEIIESPIAEVLPAEPAASPPQRAVKVTGNAPDPERLTPAPFIWRQQLAPRSPFGISADQWRNIVGRAPVVSLCRRTLILQITATPWKLVGDDPKEVEYYTEVLENANEESFDLLVERVVDDVLTVPFGGAVEPSFYRNDILANLYHVDGGTLFPTYDEQRPYIQVDPENSNRRVYFNKDTLERLMWAPIPDIRNYGWSRTPCMEVFGAVQSLMRSDVFYDQFLSNTPEAGILDLMDMKKDAAESWVKSWQELMMGIDPMKVPVLYEHESEAKFLSFSRSPSEIALPEIVKRYAEFVISSFGMSIGDLGLFEHQNTLAGASRMMQTSKRQGLGSLMRKLLRLINLCLPKEVRFQWDPLDDEDRLRKAQAQKARADVLKILASPPAPGEQAIFPPVVIQRQVLQDGLIDVVDEEELLKILEEIEKKAEEEALTQQEQQAEQQAERQAQAVEQGQDQAQVPNQQEIPAGAPGSNQRPPTVLTRSLIRHLPSRHVQKAHGNRSKGKLSSHRSDNTLRVEPSTSPAGTSTGWKPSMARAEAESWTKGSALTISLYHGTSAEGAEGIAKSGYDMKKTASNVYNYGNFGYGMYLTPDKKKAAGYGKSTLETKVKVKKVLEPGPEMSNIMRQASAKGSLGSKEFSFTVTSLAKRAGYDAIMTQSEVVILNPKHVTVVGVGRSPSAR